MPICPNGYILGDTYCLGPCPAGYVTSVSDSTFCVQIVACPTDSVLDVSNTYKCNKTAMPKNAQNVCDAGYSQWDIINCYVDCPDSMVENGLSCLFNEYARNLVVPSCGSLSSFNNGKCVLNSSVYLFIVFIGLLLLAFVTSRLFWAS